MNSQRLFLIFLILFPANPFLFNPQAEEGIPLPHYKSSSLSSSQATTGILSQIDEKPKLYMDFLALKVDLQEKYKYGVEWDRRNLENIIGKPLQGRFIPSLKNPAMLDIGSLFIMDQDNIVQYLSQYGVTRILFRERWTQSLGEQISKEHSTVEPYIATFKDPKAGKASAVPYTQSSIRSGITLNLTIQGLQISGDEPSAEITYEIDLKDFYKTKDELPALINFLSADSVIIPFSQTLIHCHLFLKDHVRSEYIFLITPRNVK